MRRLGLCIAASVLIFGALPAQSQSKLTKGSATDSVQRRLRSIRDFCCQRREARYRARVHTVAGCSPSVSKWPISTPVFAIAYYDELMVLPRVAANLLSPLTCTPQLLQAVMTT